MEYAYGLGPYAERLGGSSPFPRTFIDVQNLELKYKAGVTQG